jgi:serine/threonine protein kinase
MPSSVLHTLVQRQESLLDHYLVPGTSVELDDHLILDIHENSPHSSCSLVLAGRKTMGSFQLSNIAQIHFRKTYTESSKFLCDVSNEAELGYEAWHATAGRVPIVIGCNEHERTIRTEYLDGFEPVSNLSPIPKSWQDSNKMIQGLLPNPPESAVLGFWKNMEDSFLLLQDVHKVRILHGDAHAANFMTNGKDLFIIDFGNARRGAQDPEMFHAECMGDNAMLMKEVTPLLQFCSPPKGPLLDAVNLYLREVPAPNIHHARVQSLGRI